MDEKYTSPEQTLSEIRQLMERSSRFISLSGMSGVMAGIYALIGSGAAYVILHLYTSRQEKVSYLVGLALMVLCLAVGTGIALTTRKARKDGSSLFDAAARKLLINLCIPLVAGGIFCIAMLYHRQWDYLVPSMLIFYGLALVHASKYTRDDVRSLGLIEVGLGSLALFVQGYELVFWAIGFGVMHIAYGMYMYFRYEK